MSYVNIKSIHNKFENLCDIVGNNFDVTIIITWLSWAFEVGYKSSQWWTSFIASLPSKILTKFKLPINIQIIPFEINLRKHKWLFVSIYKPPSQSSQYFQDLPGDLSDFYAKDYDNKAILENFNLEPSNPSIASFINNQSLFNLVKINTCFEGKGSCIGLILINRKYFFKNTCSFEAVLSDHHHSIYSVMKATFKSEEPKKLIYCDYSNFSSECFKDDFMSSICKEKYDYSDFEKKF